MSGLYPAWSVNLYRGFKQRREISGIAGVVTALDCPTCVASLYRLTRSLGRLDLWRAFNGQIFSADMVANPKQTPYLLRLCAREFGVDPADCVMIDDSVHRGVAEGSAMLGRCIVETDAMLGAYKESGATRRAC